MRNKVLSLFVSDNGILVSFSTEKRPKVMVSEYAEGESKRLELKAGNYGKLFSKRK
ncbi:MAG: hypothetical protein OEZ40_07645 [Candidatus Bathyarchaeota archaeon]|nr:hypothetical protein [Candidatus Bathyarchaeota archaeon]